MTKIIIMIAEAPLAGLWLRHGGRKSLRQRASAWRRPGRQERVQNHTSIKQQYSASCCHDYRHHCAVTVVIAVVISVVVAGVIEHQVYSRHEGCRVGGVQAS